MKETWWVKEEEQREARHSLVTGYKQESNLTQADLTASVTQLSYLSGVLS